MANQDIKQVSGITGTFQVLRNPAGQQPADGKVQPETGKESPARRVQEADLQALAAKLNVASQSIGRDLRFKVDMNSGRSVIQVLDRDTGEIIREIPPEQARIRLSGSGEMQMRLYDALA